MTVESFDENYERISTIRTFLTFKLTPLLNNFIKKGLLLIRLKSDTFILPFPLQNARDFVTMIRSSVFLRAAVEVHVAALPLICK